jgi:predicted NBD/HSP70 family sugar kinase
MDQGTSNMKVCWHATKDKGIAIAVPKYFDRRASLANSGNLDEQTVMAKVQRIEEKYGRSLFLDTASNMTFVGPNPLIRH